MRLVRLLLMTMAVAVCAVLGASDAHGAILVGAERRLRRRQSATRRDQHGPTPG